MKPMATFACDRGLKIFIDPEEVSEVSDTPSNPGTTTIAMKNGNRVVINLYASEVMRCLELAT